jgi:hypothetical protein
MPDFFRYELSKVNATEAEIPATGNHQNKLLVVFSAGKLAFEFVDGAPQAGMKDGKEMGTYGCGVEVAGTLIGRTGVVIGCDVADGNKRKGTMGGLPPCPRPEDGGLGVFVHRGGRGVLDGTGVAPGGRVWLGVLVEVPVLSAVEAGEGVSDGVGVSEGVTSGTRVSVAVGVSAAVGAGVAVSVGKGVKVAVGIGVNVFVDTGGGGET